MRLQLYKIGSVCELVKKRPITVRAWEKYGIISEPFYRTGSDVPHRAYTKAEVLLIVNAVRKWNLEHWKTVGSAVPRPSKFRLGQIYWDLFQYIYPDPVLPNNYILSIPMGYTLPDVLDFDPRVDKFDESDAYTIQERIEQTAKALRESKSLIEIGNSIKKRREFCSKVYTCKTKDAMLDVILEYNTVASGDV